MDLMIRRRLMMQKIQSGGDLPPEYQRVNYLESSGSQFIELNFGFNPNDEIILKGRLKQTGNDKFIVSPRVWNNDNNRFALYGYYTDLTCAFGSGDSLLMTLAPKINWGSEYSIVSRTFEYRDHMFMCDGSSADGSAHTFGSDTANLRLFYGYDSPTSAIIYSYTHLKNGAKTCELIPCYRKSDNKPGMYDTVTHSFLVNQGEGEFTCGPLSGSTLDNYQTIYGKAFNKQGVLVDIPRINAYQPAAILNYFSVQPGDKITYYDGRKSAGQLTPCYLLEYKADKTFFDYWQNGSNPRTITIDPDIYYIRTTIIYGETDASGVLIGEGYEEDAYIRNDTTGIYYYKGKNVQ